MASISCSEFCCAGTQGIASAILCCNCHPCSWPCCNITCSDCKWAITGLFEFACCPCVTCLAFYTFFNPKCTLYNDISRWWDKCCVSRNRPIRSNESLRGLNNSIDNNNDNTVPII